MGIRLDLSQAEKGCNKTKAGVDLNRNYGYKWGVGESTSDVECQGETYAGPRAFSEPETRAMKEFLTKNKDEIAFVVNFHSHGKMMITPMNSEFPNPLEGRSETIHHLFTEMITEAKFPDQTDFGPSSSVIGFVSGGSAGDWIVQELKIPALEPEIGTRKDFGKDWWPKSDKIAFKILKDNMPLLNYIYEKAGN